MVQEFKIAFRQCLISIWKHTSFVPLRFKPSCQSGPKALPILSALALVPASFFFPEKINSIQNQMI